MDQTSHDQPDNTADFHEGTISIPAEFLLPSRLVVSEETFEQILNLIEDSPEPTQAMRELMLADAE